MYEVSQKQNYIFRSNKLLENTGASYIIRDLTENPKKLFEYLKEKDEIKIDFVDDHAKLPDPEEKIVGGGNATYVFKEAQDAEKFARLLSANVLRYFPGLELFLVKEGVNWNEESLNREGENSGIIQKLSDKLSDKKNRREHAVFQKSWGIHQVCQRSGLPANALNSDNEAWSKEFAIKEQMGKTIRNDRYRQRFILNNSFLTKNESERKKYYFVKHDDWEKTLNEEQGGQASKSYLAIVSLDGNAMGVKVQQFFESLNEKLQTKGTIAEKNDAYLKGQQQLSADIDDFFTEAFQRTIAHVMKDFDRWAKSIYGKDIFCEKNKTRLEKAKKIVPIRPVVFSGDDVSFITYGVLGLEITRIFLQYLQQKPIKIDENESTMNACAGVAIIPFRYPFWLGFDLAEKLCDHAKARLLEDDSHWKKLTSKDDATPYDTSLIDWQLVEKGGVFDSVKDFRNKYYQTKDSDGRFSSLTMRPYYIQHKEESNKHFASYEGTFLKTIDGIRKTIKESAQEDSDAAGVSKWKQLRDVYHHGALELNQWILLNRFKSVIDDINAHPIENYYVTYKDGFGLLGKEQDKDGEKFAYYYDALEIYDYFVRLSGVNNDE